MRGRRDMLTGLQGVPMQRATRAGAGLVLAVLLQPALHGRAAQQAGATPTIDQLISLKRVGSPTISPNGQWVAYTVREANWDENNYHTCLLYTSDAADERSSVDLGGRRIIK